MYKLQESNSLYIVIKFDALIFGYVRVSDAMTYQAASEFILQQSTKSQNKF